MTSTRTTITAITGAAKRSAWNKQIGGFSVYQLSNGSIDYFPLGQPANIEGEPDRQAKLISRYRWNHVRWSRID